MSAELTATPKKQISIWWFAFGYFAAYVPYSFMTKILTKGLLGDGPKDPVNAVNSFEILPPTIMASIIVMIAFISIMGWWKFATQWKLKLGSKELSLPRPRLWTLFSGICTGLVVVTTTLAYTIDGVSIVFAMLLMRGGMLIMSPIVDAIFKKPVKWFSWAALGMSLLALLISNLWEPFFSGKSVAEVTAFNAMLGLDLVFYLASYFVRLSCMSKLAKSQNSDDTKKFFVEEQMVGTPSIFIILIIAAIIGGATGAAPDSLLGGIHAGFTTFWNHPGNIIAIAMAIGFCSQFNGVFGGLILLYPSENSFAVPVNRCSSILAGVAATCMLALFFSNYKWPQTGEFVGAAFVVGAVMFLALPKYFAGRKKALAAKADVKADEVKAEEVKADEAKADDVKAEEVKADEAKADEAKADEVKADEAKTDEAKTDEASDEKKAE